MHKPKCSEMMDGLQVVHKPHSMYEKNEQTKESDVPTHKLR